MDIILRSFINRLEALPDKLSVDVLRKFLLENDGRQLPADEYISFSDKDYKRNIVHVSSKCEFTVLCFKKGQITPIHDHGGSLGITIIRKGTFTEELFNKLPTGMIAPTFTRRFHMSELSYINLATIHRVSNAHNGNLVTMNIYFPPLTLMNIYNLENTQVGKWTADYSNTKSM